MKPDMPAIRANSPITLPLPNSASQAALTALSGGFTGARGPDDGVKPIAGHQDLGCSCALVVVQLKVAAVFVVGERVHSDASQIAETVGLAAFSQVRLAVLADADDKGGLTLDSAPAEWDCPEF